MFLDFSSVSSSQTWQILFSRCLTNILFIHLTATTETNNNQLTESVYNVFLFVFCACLSTKNSLVLISTYISSFCISCRQPSLFRPAILSEQWAPEQFIGIFIPPSSALGSAHCHHRLHKRNHSITGTPAAAGRARHLSLCLSQLRLAPQPHYKPLTLHTERQRRRLVIGQRGKEEHFQLELGGEASQFGAAQSGSLGDGRPTRSREREAGGRPLKETPLSFTVVTFPPCPREPYARLLVV